MNLGMGEDICHTQNPQSRGVGHRKSFGGLSHVRGETTDSQGNAVREPSPEPVTATHRPSAPRGTGSPRLLAPQRCKPQEPATPLPGKRFVDTQACTPAPGSPADSCCPRPGQAGGRHHYTGCRGGKQPREGRNQSSVTRHPWRRRRKERGQPRVHGASQALWFGAPSLQSGSRQARG